MKPKCRNKIHRFSLYTVSSFYTSDIIPTDEERPSDVSKVAQITDEKEEEKQEEEEREGEEDGKLTNLTIISIVNSESFQSLNAWLHTLLVLDVQCTIKLLVDDKQTELILTDYFLENFAQSDSPTINVLLTKNVKQGADSSHAANEWSGRFKVVISELLLDRDVLFVNLNSIWLKDPMPLIWNEYEKYHLWGVLGDSKSKLDARFLYFKASLLNIRLLNEWMDQVISETGNTRSISDAITISLSKTVSRYERNWPLKVKTLSIDMFPSITESIDVEWIKQKKDNTYLLFGNNLGKDFKLHFLLNLSHSCGTFVNLLRPNKVATVIDQSHENKIT